MKDKKMFISYSHKDDKRKTEIVELLEKYSGYEVWVDDRLHTGQEYFSVIANKIMEAEIFTLLVSKNAIESTFVKQELEYAKSKNKKIISIWLDDVKLPSNFEFILHNSQYLLWYKYSDKQQVIEEIKNAFENKDVSIDNPTKTKEVVKPKKKWKWIALVGVILVLACVGYLLIQNPLNTPEDAVVEFNDVDVHMNFPEKWDVNYYKEEADLDRTSLYASDESSGIDFCSSTSWRGEYLTSMEMNRETIKELTELYREDLKEEEWEEISFEEKEISEQKYLVIEGVKPVHIDSVCIYLTIVDNTLIEFKFNADKEFIDDAMKDSIDSIMNSVKYVDK